MLSMRWHVSTPTLWLGALRVVHEEPMICSYRRTQPAAAPPAGESAEDEAETDDTVVSPADTEDAQPIYHRRTAQLVGVVKARPGRRNRTVSWSIL